MSRPITILVLAASAAMLLWSVPVSAADGKVALAIHGGAGTIRRADLTAEQEAAYREKLEEALQAGHAVLTEGGPALDAVVAAIRVMEDSPLFNAGKGAVFTADGGNELDASIMHGDGRAGAVAGVSHVPDPIVLARHVMERSEHVMLTGSGAEDFALEQGMELVPTSYFHTDRRWQQLEDARARAAVDADIPVELKMGTVGAVALDADGHLAAGTSTGGMTYKRWGRVGDSPIIGAGTWAEDGVAAISATGHGEYFIRLGVARDIAARVAYLGETIEQAGRAVIDGKLGDMGGTGGVIIIDADGEISMPFNTEGMYRGSIGPDGQTEIEIYGD